MNNVEVSLIISNDKENFQAVKKVSDKLTVVNCYMSKKEGDKWVSAPLTVKVTSATKMDADVKLEPKAHIDVSGFFSPEEYESNGTKKNYFSLIAKEIKASEQKENASSTSAAAPTSTPTSTSAPTPTSTPVADTTPVVPDEEDLPFV